MTMTLYAATPSEATDGLRPDVALLVDTLARRNRCVRGAAAWTRYAASKVALDRCCGWSAGPRCDVVQFAKATTAYVLGVGL